MFLWVVLVLKQLNASLITWQYCYIKGPVCNICLDLWWRPADIYTEPTTMNMYTWSNPSVNLLCQKSYKAQHKGPVCNIWCCWITSVKTKVLNKLVFRLWEGFSCIYSTIDIVKGLARPYLDSSAAGQGVSQLGGQCASSNKPMKKKVDEGCMFFYFQITITHLTFDLYCYT